MKRILFSFLILIFSCTQTTEKPDDLLDENQMAAILEEVFLYQQSSYQNEMKNPMLDYAKIDAELIMKHGATVTQFRDSYQFYVLNPEKYNEILLKVREDLEKKLPEQERIRREQARKEIENSK